MKPRRSTPPQRSRYALLLSGVLALALVMLALLPRLTHLDARALMHDESLFSYYAYQSLGNLKSFRENPPDPSRPSSPRYIYTHMPILHGPVLVVGAAYLFDTFGDSIAVARTAIAICSFFAIAASLALWPRRLRWWLAPLLFTSPVLLFYSRFFRNEMLFNAFLMVGMLGVVNGLSRRRGHVAWSILGVAFMLFLLAIKENALFPYASAVCFAALYLALRLLRRFAPRWNRALRRLRRPHRAPLATLETKKTKKNKQAESYLKPSFAAVVGDEPAGAPSPPPAHIPPIDPARRRALFGWTLCISGWLAGLALGFLLIALAMGQMAGQDTVTLGPPDNTIVVNSSTDLTNHPCIKTMRSLGWLNLYASWHYWEGQHSEHRIAGPLHYHLPILVTYELPLLLLIYIGIGWDALLRRSRALLHLAGLIAWIVLWRIWGWIGPPDQGDDAGLIEKILNFLHLEPNASILIIGLLLVPLLVWSFLMLLERRPLASWMGWWAACSLFQYSSAGEKVPWLTVHIALPFYLAVAWVWAPLLARRILSARVVFILMALGGAAIGLRADLRFIGDDGANPRERLIFNHTTTALDSTFKHHLARWEEQKDVVPLIQRRVLAVDGPGVGGPSWPGFWYFRHCSFQSTEHPASMLDQNWDLVIGHKETLLPVIGSQGGERWNVQEMSLRDHWWAPWPSKELWLKWLDARSDKSTPADSANAVDAPPRFAALIGPTLHDWWIYYWYRKPWTDPGYFKIVVLDPVAPSP
jgi:predicted membrane-bound mannosyltransferase